MARVVRWGSRFGGLVAFLAVAFLASLWFAASATETLSLDRAESVLIINDAGPVRIRSLDALGEGPDATSGNGPAVRIMQSWLVSRPEVESLASDGASVIRVSCPGRFPCRAALEVFVPEGIELSVVAAEDVIQVDTFRGELALFAGDGGVSLGSVSGSVNIVSTGSVEGVMLGPAALTVDVVDGPVDLRYLDPPTLLSVVGEGAAVSVELPQIESYDIAIEAPDIDLAIESDSSAGRRVVVRTGGSVSIGPAGETDG